MVDASASAMVDASASAMVDASASAMVTWSGDVDADGGGTEKVKTSAAPGMSNPAVSVERHPRGTPRDSCAAPCSTDSCS